MYALKVHVCACTCIQKGGDKGMHKSHPQTSCSAYITSRYWEWSTLGLVLGLGPRLGMHVHVLYFEQQAVLLFFSLCKRSGYLPLTIHYKRKSFLPLSLVPERLGTRLFYLCKHWRHSHDKMFPSLLLLISSLQIVYQIIMISRVCNWALILPSLAKSTYESQDFKNWVVGRPGNTTSTLLPCSLRCHNFLQLRMEWWLSCCEWIWQGGRRERGGGTGGTKGGRRREEGGKRGGTTSC